MIAEHPWLGRGFGTFTPEEYLLLDNEIQKLAIETGVIGVAVPAAFTLGVIWTASVAGQTGTRAKAFATALIASILGVMISWYTFDAFFYHILMGVLFIDIGLVGSLWRLTAAVGEAGPAEFNGKPSADDARYDDGANAGPRPYSAKRAARILEE